VFEIGFSKDDLKRAVWTFIQGFGAVLILSAADLIQSGEDWTTTTFWLSLVVGAIAAGISAVKNLVLADSSALK